jgi:hypothetical protein
MLLPSLLKLLLLFLLLLLLPLLLILLLLPWVAQQSIAFLGLGSKAWPTFGCAVNIAITDVFLGCQPSAVMKSVVGERGKGLISGTLHGAGQVVFGCKRFVSCTHPCFLQQVCELRCKRSLEDLMYSTDQPSLVSQQLQCRLCCMY